MIQKIKEKLLKSKAFAKDMLVNTIAFGIYIISQQIVLMPSMSKMLLEEAYSKYILYISIFAIITNVLGSELGIVRQIRGDKEKGGDYNRILLGLLPIIIVTATVSLRLLKYSVLDIVFFNITILMANIRLYAGAYFRMNKTFKKVMFQNILYLLGIFSGILLHNLLPYVWMPTFIAEILALVYSIINTDILRVGIDKTDASKDITKTFVDLGFIALLSNGITYFDKILIYPILGDAAVTIYYATSSMSKIISLIVNPLHGVMLSWLKSDDKKFKSKILSLTIKANIPMILIVFVISIPLTMIAIKILYSQYFEQSKIIIIPVCIGLAFATATSITKAIVLKYVNSKKITRAYMIYFVIFVTAVLIMSRYFGLVGFAYANVIAKIALWGMFLALLGIHTKNIDEGDQNEGKE